MNLKESDEIANSENPDQNVKFRNCLIWVYTNSVNPGQTAPSGRLFNSFPAS